MITDCLIAYLFPISRKFQFWNFYCSWFSCIIILYWYEWRTCKCMPTVLKLDRDIVYQIYTKKWLKIIYFTQYMLFVQIQFSWLIMLEYFLYLYEYVKLKLIIKNLKIFDSQQFILSIATKCGLNSVLPYLLH